MQPSDVELWSASDVISWCTARLSSRFPRVSFLETLTRMEQLHLIDGRILLEMDAGDWQEAVPSIGARKVLQNGLQSLQPRSLRPNTACQPLDAARAWPRGHSPTPAERAAPAAGPGDRPRPRHRRHSYPGAQSTPTATCPGPAPPPSPRGSSSDGALQRHARRLTYPGAEPAPCRPPASLQPIPPDGGGRPPTRRDRRGASPARTPPSGTCTPSQGLPSPPRGLCGAPSAPQSMRSVATAKTACSVTSRRLAPADAGRRPSRGAAADFIHARKPDAIRRGLGRPRSPGQGAHRTRSDRTSVSHAATSAPNSMLSLSLPQQLSSFGSKCRAHFAGSPDQFHSIRSTSEAGSLRLESRLPTVSTVVDTERFQEETARSGAGRARSVRFDLPTVASVGSGVSGVLSPALSDAERPPGGWGRSGGGGGGGGACPAPADPLTHPHQNDFLGENEMS